jgi:hypothetical protein
VVKKPPLLVHLPNMQVLPGNNTGPVALRPKLQGSFHPAIDFQSIICVKLHFLL